MVQVKVLEEHMSMAGILGLIMLLAGGRLTKLMLARYKTPHLVKI